MCFSFNPGPLLSRLGYLFLYPSNVSFFCHCLCFFLFILIMPIVFTMSIFELRCCTRIHLLFINVFYLLNLQKIVKKKGTSSISPISLSYFTFGYELDNFMFMFFLHPCMC